jgi:prepilin-type N-terminal cleavage/methylation domain-containing protein
MKNKGITLIEIIVAISILAIIIAITIPSLSNFRNEQILKNTTEDIVSLLNQARNQTLASKNSTNYGVHFDVGNIIFFNGGVFSDSDPNNKVITLDDAVSIPEAGVSLNGDGDDVIFNRLSGDTNQFGIIMIQLNSNASAQKTITISKTGVVSSN